MRWKYTLHDIDLRYNSDDRAFYIWACRTVRRSLQYSWFWKARTKVSSFPSNPSLDISLVACISKCWKIIHSYQMCLKRYNIFFFFLDRFPKLIEKSMRCSACKLREWCTQNFKMSHVRRREKVGRAQMKFQSSHLLLLWFVLIFDQPFLVIML